MDCTHSRREFVRGGVALALATSLAGCGDDASDADGVEAANTRTPTPGASGSGGDDRNADSGSPAAEASRVPGIEDGTVVDPRELARAHEAVLQERSGRLVAAEAGIDQRSGRTIRSSVAKTGVSGDRLFAAFEGDHLLVSPESTRREVYVEGSELYHRERIDGEWGGQEIDSELSTLRLGELTGRFQLEMMLGGNRVVGVTPGVDDQFLLRSPVDPSRERDEEGVQWYRNSVVVDEHGLCHEWQHTTEDRRGETWETRLHEARIEDLLETSVPRPRWVDEFE